MPEDWEPAGASTYPYKVLFNNVDDNLLETARATLPKIVANIKKAVGLEATACHRSISILQLSKIWFNNELLRELLNRVHDALPSECVSAKEMLGFIVWNYTFAFIAAALKNFMIQTRRLKQYTQQKRSASLTSCTRKSSRVCQRSERLLMQLAVIWLMMCDVPPSAWCHCMCNCEKHAEKSSYKMRVFFVKMITMSVSRATHASRVALPIFKTQTRLLV